MMDKKYISFKSLDDYIGMPVFDNKQNKWKILKAYSRVDDTYMVMYTETDFQRNGNGWEEYNEQLLSIS